MATMTLYSKAQETVIELETPKLDFIGDVHGCHDELMKMLGELGYIDGYHPENRKLVFLGDITDRGPENLKAFEEVYNLYEKGHVWLMGNHDNKLFRYLKGNEVKARHGLASTISQMENTAYRDFAFADKLLKELPYKLKLETEAEAILAAHAFPTGKNMDSCIYGPTDSMADRLEWWDRKHSLEKPRTQVFGHYWKDFQIGWQNDTKICIDGSCVDGENLVCFRYPERTFVRIKSNFSFSYFEPSNF